MGCQMRIVLCQLERGARRTADADQSGCNTIASSLRSIVLRNFLPKALERTLPGSIFLTQRRYRLSEPMGKLASSQAFRRQM